MNWEMFYYILTELHFNLPLLLVPWLCHINWEGFAVSFLSDVWCAVLLHSILMVFEIGAFMSQDSLVNMLTPLQILLLGFDFQQGCRLFLYITLSVEQKRNLMAHGNARAEKWRGKTRMERVASTRQLVHPVLLPTTKTCDTLACSTLRRELSSKIRQFQHHCFRITLN